jgi:hypothetical protein
MQSRTNDNEEGALQKLQRLFEEMFGNVMDTPKAKDLCTVEKIAENDN